jgi:nucleotide-binding universal stress UspA family protein
MPQNIRSGIEEQIRSAIVGRMNGSSPSFLTSIVENSVDAGNEIIRTAGEAGADLIVLKARKGVRSALHYGSLVERITRRSNVPVLLLPSRFLDSSRSKSVNFRQVLFDYDFSEATDQLFPFAMDLTEGFHANLHLLTVLEPPSARSTEVARSASSRDLLKNATRQKLDQIIAAESGEAISKPATVAWGKHAETVLNYAENNRVDLICTTLSPPYFYHEKLYCAYLGQLLQTANCPILALRSV